MKLGTHMPDGERRKPIDIEVCRTKVKVTTFKNRTKKLIFFLFPHKAPNYITRHCPSICSQLGFRTFGALLIFT
jgi:hypothetical protein